MLSFPGLTLSKKINLKCVKHVEFSTKASFGCGLKMRFLHKRLCTGDNYRPKPMLLFPGLTSFKKINLKCVKHVEFSTRASKGGGLKMRLSHKRLCTCYAGGEQPSPTFFASGEKRGPKGLDAGGWQL